MFLWINKTVFEDKNVERKCFKRMWERVFTNLNSEARLSYASITIYSKNQFVRDKLDVKDFERNKPLIIRSA